MKVSFIIPTRQRVQALINGIKSIKNTASPDVLLEFLIRADDNDQETLNARDLINAEINVLPRFTGQIIYGPRYLGYNNGCGFLNELSAMSQGDWLFPFSDDMIMVTKHWDKLLPPIDPIKRAWIHWIALTGSWTWALPIMTRRLYELWGCYAPSSPVDAMLFQMWQMAGKPLQKEEEFKIVVEHYRNEFNIFAIAIKQENMIPPPADPNLKDTNELLKILKESA